MKLNALATVPRIVACVCVAIAFLLAAGCDLLQDEGVLKINDDTDVSINPDDVIPPEELTGSVVITDADGDWGTDELCSERRQNKRRYASA